MKFYVDGNKTLNVNTATISGQYVDFFQINFSAAKDLSGFLGGSGDAGRNNFFFNNITFTPAITCYWKTTTSGIKQWSDANNWVTTSGGLTQARIPLPQDNVVFDNLSIGAAGTIVNYLNSGIAESCIQKFYKMQICFYNN